MLGLIFLYYIGKQFYYLAEDHKKSQWLFAILGVVVYYLGTFIGGIILVLLWTLQAGAYDESNDIFLSLLSIPFGLLLCWGFYTLLKKSWEKVQKYEGNDILDSGMM